MLFEANTASVVDVINGELQNTNFKCSTSDIGECPKSSSPGLVCVRLLVTNGGHHLVVFLSWCCRGVMRKISFVAS